MADPDTPNWINAALGALGLGTGGIGGWLFGLSNKQSAHTEQLKNHREQLARHEDSIDAIRSQGLRTEGTLNGLDRDMDEVKKGIKKLVDHATGTNLG